MTEVCYEPPPKTYEQVHAGLRWYWGRASEYRCVGCSGDAADWCYQYEAAVELRTESGVRYSENFWDYSPMCKSCHRRFDHRMDHDAREKQRLGSIKGGRISGSKRTPAQMKALGLLGGAARTARLEADNNFRQTVIEDVRKRNEERRKCSECDLATIPMALGMHHKFSGHVGYVVITEQADTP